MDFILNALVFVGPCSCFKFHLLFSFHLYWIILALQVVDEIAVVFSKCFTGLFPTENQVWRCNPDILTFHAGYIPVIAICSFCVFLHVSFRRLGIPCFQCTTYSEWVIVATHCLFAHLSSEASHLFICFWLGQGDILLTEVVTGKATCQGKINIESDNQVTLDKLLNPITSVSLA